MPRTPSAFISTSHPSLSASIARGVRFIIRNVPGRLAGHRGRLPDRRPTDIAGTENVDDTLHSRIDPLESSYVARIVGIRTMARF
jgi:hypothetical protein